ncbi:hypothetical protein MKX01_018907 [Papaver californicum]|nr:hypothetical protein MKX01_018907 [Papaver californicum]
MLYENAGMIKHAVDTFYTMHLFGCPRTVISYNAALKALGQTRNVEDIKSFFLDVPGKFDISIDVYSLNIVTKAFCEVGLLDTAYLVMIEMEKAGIRADVVTYNTLLSAFYKNDWCVIGNGLWNLMLHKGCSPNLATFNLRIQYLVKKRRAWQANSLMGKMQFLGVKPDKVTYNLVIKGFFQAGYSLMAKKVYSALHFKGGKPNRKIYQTMIHWLCVGGEFDEAFTICKGSMEKNWFPSIDTICKLVVGLLKSSKSRNANIIMALVRGRTPPFSKKEMEYLEYVNSQTLEHMVRK